jgi:hypothetical protein
MSESTSDMGSERFAEAADRLGLTGFKPGDPPPRADAALRQRFGQLYREWKDATKFSSSTNEIAMHPAYQQIIGMGREAIPLIVEELRRQPDHWFWALKAITGEDPVDPSDRGRVRRMADVWLKWAQDHGYR